MKKLVSLALVTAMLFSCMVGCKKNESTSSVDDGTYTSELGIIVMDGDEVLDEQEDNSDGSNKDNTSSDNTDNNNTGNNSTGNKNTGNNSTGNNTGNSNSQTTSTPITVNHGDKEGYFLNDLNNTGKKATLKNNCYSSGYPIANKTITFDVMIKDYSDGKSKYNLLKINDFLKEKMNVKINWNPVSANDLNNKMVLAFSSGNMPDMFWGCEPFGYTNRYNYGSQGLLLELDKYIDTYAPNIKRMFKEDPETKYVVTCENGKIYSTPMLNGDRDPFVYEGLYINKTWLDKLNLSMPTTTNSFMKVLQAFKDNDPNGNGKADEIPLCLLGTNMAGILPACLYGPFGLSVYGSTAGVSINNSGKAVANFITDNYKTALTYYKTLYKKGLIDSEWTTNTETVLKTKLNTSTPTVGAFVSENVYKLIDSVDRVEQYTLLPAFVDKSAGKATWSITNVENLWAGWAMVSSKCKYPEAAVRVIDYFYSLEGTLTALLGPQGYNWDVKKDGTIYMTDDYYKSTHTGLTPGYTVPNYKTEKYIELTDLTKSNLTEEKTKKTYQALKDIRNTYIKYAPKNIKPNLISYDSDIIKGKETSSQLTTYVQQLAIEFVTGKTDIGVFWDNYVSVCKSLGVDNSVYYTQVAYDRYVKAVK